MDKQELPINNPAERLYVILTTAAETSNGYYISQVICKAMQIEHTKENFIKGFNELLTLLEVIEKEVKQYFSSRKQRSYLSLIKEIKISIVNAFALGVYNNNSKWSDVENLNDKNWPILQSFNACVDDFEENGMRYGISIKKDLLNDLINDVDIWIKEINESQLDKDVKDFFIHKFMEIKHLLEKYYYYGSSRIKTEIYATIMEIGIYQGNFTEDKKDESRNFLNTFLGKLFDLAAKFEPLVSLLANGSVVIPGGINIIKNLLSGS
ncbi:MAG: hypothetical protein VKJ02_08760 [Snowella sp.]|nr:hypothetical protein [Snowella sp.]